MNLYRLLAEKGQGHGVNWNAAGELIVAGHRIPGSNVVELLTDAVRKKSKVKPPVGRDVFVKIVKKLNPTLKHVKNKSVFDSSSPSPLSPLRRRTVSKKGTPLPTPKRRTSKKKSQQQVGSGRRRYLKQIIWRTKL